MYHECAWYPQTPEDSIRSRGTRVMNGCKPSCRLWDLNLSPLEEQRVPKATEPSLQPSKADLEDDHPSRTEGSATFCCRSAPNLSTA